MRKNRSHQDRIGRPVHVGDTVQHRVSRETAVVVELVGKTRILVRKTDGSTIVWYADQTML